MGKKRRRSDWLRSYGGRKKEATATPHFPHLSRLPKKEKKKNLNFFLKRATPTHRPEMASGGGGGNTFPSSSFFKVTKSIFHARRGAVRGNGGECVACEIRACVVHPMVHVLMQRCVSWKQTIFPHRILYYDHVRTLWSPIFGRMVFPRLPKEVR